jgi:Vacuolar import and degradation protein
MCAHDIPNASGPITTLWHGEVIDMRHHSFESAHLGMDLATDFSCWLKLPEFAALRCYGPAGLRHIRPADLAACGCVFMRLKEREFLSHAPTDAAVRPGILTIAGFYYTAVDRETGAIAAWYFDPNSQPLQRLSLAPEGGDGPVSFGQIVYA